MINESVFICTLSQNMNILEGTFCVPGKKQQQTKGQPSQAIEAGHDTTDYHLIEIYKINNFNQYSIFQQIINRYWVQLHPDPKISIAPTLRLIP